MATGTMSKVITAAVRGLDTEIVTVETDLTVGLPAFSLVGLPGSAVRESKNRVEAAIVNSGYDFPLRRITVNLSPADARKEGSHFDLPIAIGILAAAAQGRVDAAFLGKTAFIGELSLDGAVRRTDLAAAMVLGLMEAGVNQVFLPADNLPDVIELPGMAYFPVTQLWEAVSHLLGEAPMACVRGGVFGGGSGGGGMAAPPQEGDAGDFYDVKGQEQVKRALLIAVAGRHDIAITGPPGVGKSMLARRVPGIMQPLSEKESREVTRIHNIAGAMGKRRGLLTQRPYRAPHHSATQVAIIGGGAGHRLIPGEVSLAHRGVLFLDELPEFERRALDMLRQPLEDRYIDLSRVGAKGRYPCDFLLICAMNPCPCGYYGDPAHTCTCTENARQRYRAKISGPLLDRIDIHVRLGAVEESALAGAQGGCMGTAAMRALVLKAESAQRARFSQGAADDPVWNARLTNRQVEDFCPMEGGAQSLLKKAYAHFALSMRARGKIVKVARTIADVEGEERIGEAHIAEAIAYRTPENWGRHGF
ncbi:MAG: YifB family Mg chelatase-like AAA ATPase [Clostridiales Family XIII bacterium]|jgi:magnesium chelatase family protein|nr:YifB family Mg chelatase-like AAA ATPase [Clostridiales Family XIII bacterium]